MTRTRQTPFSPEHRVVKFSIPREMVDHVIRRCESLGLPVWQYAMYCMTKNIEEHPDDGTR